MAGDNQQFCLRWNNHQSTLISVFDSLLESGTLVDCTLAAEGQYLKAHKVVLSACSPYLELLLSQHYEKHPIVILKDVKFQELKSMMDYMYRGEVNITQDQLATFLKAAESLQIKGLSESSGSTDDARDVGSTAKRPREEPPPRRPVPPHPQARLPHSSGLTIEPRRSIPHSSEMAPASPMKSREGSTSPVARKRRRRRPSGGDDASNAALSDSQLDTSNSCDLPPVSNQAQSTPISVPSILATPSASNNQSESDQPLETEALSRFPNTTGSELMVKTKMEPNTDQLIEPKTEYLEDINNEDSVEDLTLDDDDEMPGPSHADGSNQNFSQWQMAGDRSTDEVFMAAQEAVGAHRDSQVVVPDISMVLENSMAELKSYKTHSKSIKRWQEQLGSSKNHSNRMDSMEKLPPDTELISVTPTPYLEPMSPRSHFSPNSGTPPVHGQRHQQRNSYAASPSFPGPAFPDNSFGVEGGPFNALLGFDLLQGAPADFPSVVRTEIKNLLERSNDGLSILVYFEKNQTLSNSLRSKLVQIVIEHECRGDPGRKITTDRFIELAAMIAKTFPNESPAAYYVPFSIENGRQKNAQGKLWARYNNQKRLYRSTGLLKSARHHDSLFSDMFFLSAR